MDWDTKDKGRVRSTRPLSSVSFRELRKSWIDVVKTLIISKMFQQDYGWYVIVNFGPVELQVM
jgi:hypothetical protein